ncbi:MAG: TRAP transporter large permease subunit [Alphaproteobacteria bacterium]|nr:TRAP transporter large permease subunit [Alphaproteobacteria bacterium]
MSLSFVWLFVILFVSGAPIAFALIAGPAIGVSLSSEQGLIRVLVSRLYNGIDSYPLLAVPLFLLAGETMNASGVTGTLVRLAQSFFGHFRGGLAQVNIAASILFAGMSGSAVADTSALGRILVPGMRDEGYPTPFAAAVTAASSVIGPIIPPSGIMIIYAFVMNVSVGGLFAAGIVPGLMMGGAMMLVTGLIARKRNYPKGDRADWKQRVASARAAMPALATPAILLGGIFSGIFTPTEAAAVAAAYAILLAAFGTRQIKATDIAGIFIRTARQASVVLFLVGASVSFSWMLTTSGMGDVIASTLANASDERLKLLFALNLILLIVGMFLDAGPAILILGPALGPVFVAIGVEPLHFAIIMCVNLTVGLTTPPIGLALFVASTVADEAPERVATELAPFLATHILIIILITFIPAIPLAIPRALGFA